MTARLFLVPPAILKPDITTDQVTACTEDTRFNQGDHIGSGVSSRLWGRKSLLHILECFFYDGWFC